MSGYSHATILGRLTRDPETKTVGKTSVTKFGVAVNRKYKTASGEYKEQATFLDVVMWGNKGAAFSRFHRRGEPCFIVGDLRQDRWEDKTTGEKKSRVYVNALEFEFVGGKSEPAPASDSAQQDWQDPDNMPF